LEIEPTERGSGIVFQNAIVGGKIPREYIPAIEAGVRQALDNGPLGGYPLVDLTIKLVDGSYHTVDSSEMAFRSAGSLAMRLAGSKGRPVLLEPIVEMEVVTPDDFLGEVIGDLGTRRAQIRNIEGESNLQTIKAHIPLGETFAYTTALRSLSSGRATYTMEFKHYEPVSESVLKAIIQKV